MRNLYLNGIYELTNCKMHEGLYLLRSRVGAWVHLSAGVGQWSCDHDEKCMGVMNDSVMDWGWSAEVMGLLWDVTNDWDTNSKPIQYKCVWTQWMNIGEESSQ